MPTNEKFHPIQVGFFSAQAIVLATNVRAHLVQKPDGLAENSAGFHGFHYNCFFVQYNDANPCWHWVFKDFYERFKPQERFYTAGFAVYITLGFSQTRAHAFVR